MPDQADLSTSPWNLSMSALREIVYGKNKNVFEKAALQVPC